MRIAFLPDGYENERIESVRRFCLRYGVKNVMLFVNNEENFVGHMTEEEAAPVVAVLKKAKRVLNRAGVSVSLNPWCEWGHLDFGRRLKDGQNFTAMADFNGKECEVVACPLCENWRAYYAGFTRYLLSEIRPEIHWIEDSFRLHNHEPLEYGGCFCEKHMRLYNGRPGTNYTREEFAARVFAKGAPTPERLRWIDVSRETMNDAGKFVGETIAAALPGVRVGLMSSTPQSHCIEGRDWAAVMNNLCRGGGAGKDKPLINRIHLPAYQEICPKRYYYNFNRVSMAVRAFLPDETMIYPEIENLSFCTYAKDSRFLRFQIESALPLLASGMTYDIFDFCGNGAVEGLGYGPEIRGTTRYMQAVLDLGLRFSSMKGVVVPIDERASRNLVSRGGAWTDLSPKDFDSAAYLSALGVTYRFDRGKAFRDETVVLFEDAVDNFTDGQTAELFAGNYVYLNGRTAQRLIERGLGRLIGAESAVLHGAHDGFQAYERVAEGTAVGGIRGCKANAQWCAGDWFEIRYGDKRQLTERSGVYGWDGRYVGAGFASSKKGGSAGFAVNPYTFAGLDVDGYRTTHDQYHPLRRAAVTDILRSSCKKETIVTDYCGLHPYLFENGRYFVLILVNATLNALKKTELSVWNVRYGEVLRIGKDGGVKAAPHARDGETLKLNFTIGCLSAAVLLLEKADR